MKNVQFEISYKIKFLSSYSINSGFSSLSTNNSIVTIASEDNAIKKLYIPGSTIKGRMKYYTQQLLKTLGFKNICEDATKKMGCIDKSACPICRIFGNTHKESGIYFNSALPDDDWSDHSAEISSIRQQRAHVAIEKKSGTCREGQLFFSEYSIPGLSFKSSITGTVSSEERIPEELVYLACAIQEVEFIGHSKSTGIGRCNAIIDLIKLDGKDIELREVIEKLERRG